MPKAAMAAFRMTRAPRAAGGGTTPAEPVMPSMQPAKIALRQSVFSLR